MSPATIYMLSASISFGMASPILARLQSGQGPMHITFAEGSWFAVLFHLGLACGPLPTAWLMNA